MICKTNRKVKNKLCSGDLTQQIAILKRVAQGSTPGGLDGKEELTEILNPFCFVRTVNGSQRISGVNITDNTTHLFYVRWTPTIKNIDAAGNHLIRYNGKLYKIDTSTNDNELNEMVIFACSESGVENNNPTPDDISDDTAWDINLSTQL